MSTCKHGAGDIEQVRGALPTRLDGPIFTQRFHKAGRPRDHQLESEERRRKQENSPEMLRRESSPSIDTPLPISRVSSSAGKIRRRTDRQKVNQTFRNKPKTGLLTSSTPHLFLSFFRTRAPVCLDATNTTTTDQQTPFDPKPIDRKRYADIPVE